MTKTISWDCVHCKNYVTAPIRKGAVICPQCQAAGDPIAADDFNFEQCPLCPCSQFYTSKDFNQALGCAIMLIGIVFVPMTYGLSLPAMALIDWLLYRKIPLIAICYRCGAEFRGFRKLPEHFRPFLHHIGEKYDRYRK